eukprot:GFUD01038081.1.p1 GENE.GFUD01038081.1~~GFUD01038081.1.p1  ORF type:complete len:323 (-),score=114.29 GFUD01038081.1:272-1240(-)
MGNMLSYFFPQPAPACIEQVVEEVAEDVATTKKATEEPASPAQEDINDPITSDLVVEKEFEVVEDAKVVSTEQADAQLDADIQEDLPSVKETSLEVVAPTPELPTAPSPDKDLTTESIIIPLPESNKAPAPELSIASTPENAITPKADNIPTPEPARTPELPKAYFPDAVNSIHPEAVNIPTPEPTNPPTAELPTASSPEPVNAIPPEAIEDTIPESTKAPTPELPEVSSPGPVNIIPPDALNISSPSSAPELPKASTPEPVNPPPEVITVQECPEPTKAPGSDLLDVEVIGLIEQIKDGHDEKELSDGASGLKNLLTGATD